MYFYIYCSIAYMNKRYIILFSFIFLAFLHSFASCGTGQSELIVTIVPDNYPAEIHWSVRDANTNVLIDSGNANSDTVCLNSGQCTRFTIFDAASDGICCNYGNGSYSLKLNGNLIFSGGSFGSSQTTFMNCPQGTDCSNPLQATLDTMTAPRPETWYSFTPDTSGTYVISTCGLGNTCDTKLYIYDHCSGIVVQEDNVGTTFYDDDGCGTGFQSKVSAALTAGTTYYIRIGDYLTNCVGFTIKWQIHFNGPVVGCMDPASCTFNPLATISDTTACAYAPSPLCASPDLAVDATELETSMYVDNLTVGQTNCYISEGCLAGYGVRRLIRFSTHIRNVGNMDYYIGAPDTVGNQFVFDGCHGHWHYKGYAEYLLYNQSNQPLQQGFKNGFCVLDLECDGGGQAKYGCGNMGISTGCGDIYSAGLDCQWIDVTDVDTGTYTLVVRVNWDQSPDKLGHYEKTYSNNWAQVCFHLEYDAGNNKVFSILPNCYAYVDCAGDTFGNAVADCAGVCNGSGVRGDVNVNQSADSIDVRLYLEGLKDENIPYTVCNDLNGDNQITVTDAARLNSCLLQTAGTHHHPGNYQNTHKHCEFPFNVYNPFDSVTFSIADTNLVQHYIDLSIFNPSCQVLAYEFELNGLLIDSIKNLAVGNYTPDIRASANGHIVGLSSDENSLFKQLAPINFMRVYFREMTDTQICVSNVIAVVNSNYEEVLGKVVNGCVNIIQSGDTVVSNIGLISSENLSVIPNPSSGIFEIYLEGKSMESAEINVIDELGRSVYSYRNQELNNHTTIDLTGFAAGIYHMQVNLKGTILTKRLMLMD